MGFPMWLPQVVQPMFIIYPSCSVWDMSPFKAVSKADPGSRTTGRTGTGDTLDRGDMASVDSMTTLVEW